MSIASLVVEYQTGVFHGLMKNILDIGYSYKVMCRLLLKCSKIHTKLVETHGQCDNYMYPLTREHPVESDHSITNRPKLTLILPSETSVHQHRHMTQSKWEES